MGHIAKFPCGCHLPVVPISDPCNVFLDKLIVDVLMREPCIVFLVRLGRAPMAEGRC